MFKNHIDSHWINNSETSQKLKAPTKRYDEHENEIKTITKFETTNEPKTKSKSNGMQRNKPRVSSAL